MCNLVDFFAKYEIVGDKLIMKSKPTIIRTVPNFSSNLEGNNYDKYCKYQLLKYKPWDTDPNPARDYDNVSDLLFVRNWKEFLQSNLGKVNVSNWQRQLDATTKNINLENGISEYNFPEEGDEACNEWMYLARIVALKSEKNKLKLIVIILTICYYILIMGK